MQITTTYKTNSKGAAQIVARGFGKQATVAYDHALSIGANHGEAAAVLLEKNGVTSRFLHPSNQVTAKVDNTKGVFTFKKIL